MRATVKTVGLNLRSLPTMTGKIVDQLSKDDKLQIDGWNENRHWASVKVLRTGQHGWVYAADVKIDEPDTFKLPKAKAEGNRLFWACAIAFVLAMVLVAIFLR